MTQEEKNELMERLGPQDYEAYMELRRQMDVLAADERMDDPQTAGVQRPDRRGGNPP